MAFCRRSWSESTSDVTKERMEEERLQFGQKMKDARRRFEQFLITLEKNNPFLVRRTSRGNVSKNTTPQENTSTERQEMKNICYKRLSCNFEKTGDDLKLVNNRKAKSFNKRKRPNIAKKRFRHSVIGTGKEFSDLEELLDGTGNYLDCDNSRNISPEEAFKKYLESLHEKDIGSKEDTSNSTYIGNKVVIADLLQLDEDDELRNHPGNLAINGQINGTIPNEFNRAKAAHHHENLLPFLIRSKLTDSSILSMESRGDSSSVSFSKEQKRRLKKKMKQALRTPENCFYMGNL